jgi:hypothetical protein
MLSIGCGTGALERQLHAQGAFTTCDAYDIAPAAIESAQRHAQAAGISTIDYRCVDVEVLDFGEDRYDAVWFNGSLHHITELEVVLDRVRRALTEDGRLFFNEYVGANHFDFPIAQKNAIANAFRLIPDRYRTSFNPVDYGELATAPPIPDPREVKRVDPSEAVRSHDILSIVGDRFDVLALNKMGGTLLQFLLSGIAGNFRSDDPASIKFLDMLFAIEDAWIESGALDSDFVIVCAAPKRLQEKSEDAEAQRQAFTPAPVAAPAAPPIIVTPDDQLTENARLLKIIEQLQEDNRWALSEIELLRQQATSRGD